MSKKIIGLLLALCLVVGLLPMAALADGAKTTKIRLVSRIVVEVTEGGAAKYYKNSEYDMYDQNGKLLDVKGYTQVASDENNWNVKVEWPTGGIVTVTLKDAKIVNAIQGQSAYFPRKNATTGETEYKTDTLGAIIPDNAETTEMQDIKVVLEGDNFIDCSYGVIRGGVNKGFSSVTVEGKASNKLTAYGGAQGINTVDTGKLSFVNANVDIYNTNAGGSCVPIKSGSISIEGGHVKASNTKNITIQALNGDITVNGDVTTNHSLTSTANSAGLDAKKGKIVINGGNLNLTSTNACGLDAAEIIINGGNIKIETPYTGVWGVGENGAIKINGGTIEVIAKNAFNKIPILAADVDGVAGPSADDADYYDDTKYSKAYVKLGTDVQIPAGTTPNTPAQTTPNTPAGTTPAGTQGNNNPGTGDNGIVMFSALLLIAVFGIVATVAFGKKNSITE